jgi:serine/threonine-protein kinase RsbW
MRNGGDPGVPQMDTEVLRETFDLAARGTSAAEARHRSLAWLTRHAVAPEVADTAVLIISEFVANAVVHSGSTVISCALHLGGGLLRIEVTDEGTGRTSPVVRHVTPDELSGRGLLLVSALSEAWGASPAVPSGWTVWATVRTTTGLAHRRRHGRPPERTGTGRPPAPAGG